MTSDKLLILVIVFFFLGCRVSCGNMNENFAWTGGDCTCENYRKCKENSSCKTSHAQGAGCSNSKITTFDRKLKTPDKCSSTAGLKTYANVRGQQGRTYSANNFQAYRPNFPNTVTIPVQRVQTQCPACNSCCPTQQVVRTQVPLAANRGSYQIINSSANAFGTGINTVGADNSCGMCRNACCSPVCRSCGMPGNGILHKNCASMCGNIVGNR